MFIAIRQLTASGAGKMKNDSLKLKIYLFFRVYEKFYLNLWRGITFLKRSVL